MKAAIFRALDAPLTVEEIEIDQPGPHEVLIRTVASGVCHSDLHCLHGTLPTKTPAVLGHEPAGIVEEVGSEVARSSPAIISSPAPRFIAATARNACRVVRICASDARTASGAATSPAPVAEGRAAKPVCRPRRVCREDAAARARRPQDRRRIPLTAQPCSDAPSHRRRRGAEYGAGRARLDRCRVRRGRRRNFDYPGARIAGARQIIAVDIRDNKLEIARHFGATEAINGAAVDAVREIKRLSGGGVEYSSTRSVIHGSWSNASTAWRRAVSPPGRRHPAGSEGGIQIRTPVRRRNGSGLLHGSNRFHLDMPKYLDRIDKAA